MLTHIYGILKKKMEKKTEKSLGDLWDILNTNIHAIGVPNERKERKQQRKKTFDEIMAKNFPNLKTNITPQIQETQ